MEEPGETTLYSRQMADTPAGTLTIFVSSTGLAGISFGGLPEVIPEDPATVELLEQVCAQLREYFHGERRKFDLPIDWSRMGDYQREVLRACCAIPYGEVRTYGGLARLTGRPKAARAVGRIMASNPIPIVIPCHRVIGSNGSLTGYGGGLEVKARLLKMEGSQLAD